MAFTRVQRQIAYKKLPLEVQNLIMSNETTELIANTLKEMGLNEELANLADSEILDTLFCLQSLDDAINNIAKLNNKSTSDLSNIKSAVRDNILNKYKIDIKEFIEANKSETIAQTSVPEIPPANLPMIEEREVAHEVPHTEPTPVVEQKLTTEQATNGSRPTIENQQSTVPGQPKKDSVNLPDYRYPDGQDPYREPLK